MDLEQWLNETPDPLVIDVEPIRMCSESVEIIDSEVTKFMKNSTYCVCAATI